MASKHGLYGASLTGDWGRLGTALATLSARFPQAMEDALHEEGEFYRRKMVEGIREQAPGGQRFRPLSPVTLALRKLMGFGGTKALMRSGELRNHIVSVPGQGFVFVGILYTARGEDGRNLAEIGRLNEYGGVVRASISKARMRLIAAALRKTRGRSGGGSGGGAGIGMVHIPARPFIRPVIAEYGQRRGAERYMARVARKVGGLLGVMNHPDLRGFGVERLPERLAGGRSGAMSKGIRNMRKGGTPRKGTTKRKPFDYKKAMAQGMFKAGRGRGVRLKSRPIAERKPKIIRPKLPKTKPAKMPRRKSAQPKARTVKGRPFKPVKVKKPRTPRTVDPRKTAQREARGFDARMRQVQKQLDKGRAVIQKQRAAEVRAQQRAVAQAQRAAERAQKKVQSEQARAQKQAEKQYLRDNPQHNAHVRHRQMRINLGHLSE